MPLSPLHEAVEPVDIGVRLREIRTRRRLTLKEVADRAQISESFLSQVERGRSSTSVASLQRIAAALGTTIGELFDGGRPDSQVLLKEDRPSLALGALGKKFLLTPPHFEHMEVFVGELPVGGSSGDEQYVHGDSEELLVVTAGEVVLQLGGREHRLAAGDSINYMSSTPHRLVNAGDEPAEVLWMISPPSF